jgi:hypothetical protein
MKNLHSIHTELGFTIQSSVAAVTEDNADSMVLVPHDFVKSLVKSLPNGSANDFFKELGKMAKEMGSTHYAENDYQNLTYEEKFAKLESMMDTRRLIDFFTETLPTTPKAIGKVELDELDN